MNTFYYFESRIFETKKEAEKLAKNFINKKIEEIKTEKSFDDFEDAYYQLKKDGESDFDAIEWAV